MRGGIVAARYLPIKAQDATLRVIQRLAFGDLTRYGYATSTIGALTRVRLDGVAPAIDNGFVAGLKAGRVKIRPGSPESKVLTWLSLTEPPVGHI